MSERPNPEEGQETEESERAAEEQAARQEGRLTRQEEAERLAELTKANLRLDAAREARKEAERTEDVDGLERAKAEVRAAEANMVSVQQETQRLRKFASSRARVADAQARIVEAENRGDSEAAQQAEAARNQAHLDMAAAHFAERGRLTEYGLQVMENLKDARMEGDED